MRSTAKPWIFITTVAIASTALADMDFISYEIMGEDLIPNSYTIRLYAELGEGDRLQAVYGNSDYKLRIQTYNDASFYQNPLGGPTSQSINTAFFPLIPSLEWDSFVTIGATSTLDNHLQHMGMDWSTWDPGGGDLISDSGIWFVAGSETQGAPIDGRVLIGQFTIQSGTSFPDFYFQAMFQGVEADGTIWHEAHDFAWLAPAPSGLALLSIALLRPRRRRHMAATPNPPQL